MKNFIVYIDNGKIVKSGSCQDEVFQYQAEDGQFIIESDAKPEISYVENGIVKEMPSKPGENYVFDYDIKQWVLDESLAYDKAIIQRNQLLADGPDRISPIWWSAMTQQQQETWSKYRQDLLDITQQPDFPNVIIWPTKPTEGA